MDTSPHRVSDVMAHAVVAVDRGALFEDVVERMEQWQVSALPVLEGDGRAAGVVAEADLLHEGAATHTGRQLPLARGPALRPHVAVRDVRLPDGDGISVRREGVRPCHPGNGTSSP